MAAALLLLAQALYSLPGELPAPDAKQARRIEAALADLRDGDRERGVRALALAGRPALRAIVARLNEADAAERVLLLTAAGRLPEAAALFDQARRDPAPEVRALADPPVRPALPLKRLAARYVDLLAVTRTAHREEATEPLYELEPTIVRPKDHYEAVREYLGDEETDSAVQGEYESVSWQFARAGATALSAGALRPDLDDPVFVAYLGLLYDEDVAASRAIEGVVSAGPAVAPALTRLLERPGHDPRLLGRILVAVGRPEGLYGAVFENRPKLRFAQIELAARAFAREAAVGFLRRALHDDESRNRKAALRELVRLKADVDEFPNREAYGDDEWALSLELRAIAGDLDALMAAAEGEGAARRAFERVLHGMPAEERRPLLERMLGHAERRLQLRALDLLDDPKALLAVARERPGLRERAVLRAAALGDASGLALLADVPARAIRSLRQGGLADELVRFAAGADEELARAALRQISHLPALDRKHEEAMLALYRRAEEPLKSDAREALVPLGTDAVRDELLKSGDRALEALEVFADDGRTLPFSIPLTPFLEGADALELQRLARLAIALPSLEPGFFLKLREAWNAADIDAGQVDGGAERQKVEALRLLVRAPDPHSVDVLFGEVLGGDLREESSVVAILQAAARQLDAKRLRALVPLLESEIAAYRPGPEGLPPDPSPKRDYLVWYGMRALAFRRVPAALPMLCRTALDPSLQRERYDEQSERDLPVDWTLHAVEALRHYPVGDVEEALRGVVASMEEDGTLAEISPLHLFRVSSVWRSNAWRGRRLSGVALALCDLIDRLPYEGETGVARMLALGAQQRYVEAAAAGRAAAARVEARGYRPADGSWSPALIAGRAAIYDALAKGTIPELQPKLDLPYLQWIAGIYLRFLVGDDANATIAAERAWRNTAWLNRDMRNLCAEMMVRAGKPDAAWDRMRPAARPPVELRQDEGWYRYYLSRAAAAAGHDARARGELFEALRINRRLFASCRVDPLLKGYEGVFRQADEDYFDLLFQD